MNCKQIISIAFFVLTAFVAAADDTRTVTGEYTFYGDDNTTPKEARFRALEGARLAALAKDFGTIVTQSVISDESLKSGKEDTYFRALSETEVRGEWISDIGEPEYKVTYDGDGHPVVYCKVKGLARPISNNAADFDVAVLRNGSQLRNSDTRFNSGDDMKLYFKSPLDGYVAVYMVGDDRMAYTLLPYSDGSVGSIKVKHGKEYVFFDKEKALKEHGIVDEIVLETDRTVEHDRIYVLFSPNPFVKANDNYTSESLPRSLSFNDFHKWFTRLRKNDPTFGCKIIDIVINEKNN